MVRYLSLRGDVNKEIAMEKEKNGPGEPKGNKMELVMEYLFSRAILVYCK